MRSHSNVLLFAAATFALAFLGCSNADSPTDPAFVPHNVNSQEIAIPLTTGNGNSPFVGLWIHSNGVTTIDIKPKGVGLFAVNVEGPARDWTGIGHQRENELVVAAWATRETNPNYPDDRHWFQIFYIDHNDVMNYRAYDLYGDQVGQGYSTRAD